MHDDRERKVQANESGSKTHASSDSQARDSQVVQEADDNGTDTDRKNH